MTAAQPGESHPGYQFTAFHQIEDPEARAQLRYDLTLRQEPKQSRMCGIGEKADRRPIDPPPIVQLKVSGMRIENDLSGRFYPSAWLQNPCYFMYASLVTSDSPPKPYNLLSDEKTRSTTGSVVSNMYNLRDLGSSKEGGFFIFPDLSVRAEGLYRLKMSLFEIVGTGIHHCASIYTSLFQVYTAKRFPGMEESTVLSKYFADQGLKIRIRRESRRKTEPSSAGEDTPSRKHGRGPSEDGRRRLPSTSSNTGSGKLKHTKTPGYGASGRVSNVLEIPPLASPSGTEQHPGNREDRSSRQRPQQQQGYPGSGLPSASMPSSQIPAGLSWDDVWTNPLRVQQRSSDRLLPPRMQTPSSSNTLSQPPYNPHYYSSPGASTKMPGHGPDFQDYRYDPSSSMTSMSGQSVKSGKGLASPVEASSLLAYLAASSKPEFQQQMDSTTFIPEDIPGSSNHPTAYQGLGHIKPYPDIDPDRAFAFDKGQPNNISSATSSHSHQYRSALPMQQPHYMHYGQPPQSAQPPQSYPLAGGQQQYTNDPLTHLYYDGRNPSAVLQAQQQQQQLYGGAHRSQQGYPMSNAAQQQQRQQSQSQSQVQMPLPPPQRQPSQTSPGQREPSQHHRYSNDPNLPR